MSASRKILVVDDDPVVGKSFDRVLTGKGYVVITAANGEEALRKIKDEHYDLVFTDIKMPGIGGIEVAERVKASQPWLPVVIVTGYGTGENERRAAAAGVSGFLHKPLSPQMIEETAALALAEANTAAPVEMKIAFEEASVTRHANHTLTVIKNTALFFASPFIGLLYVVAMPLVGAGALAWMVAKKFPVVKTVAMLCAAPFIGLAYFFALPFVGFGALIWFGSKAVMRRA